MLKGAVKWGLGIKSKKDPEKPKRSDDIIIKIYQRQHHEDEKGQVELSSGEGNWLSYLSLDNEVVWRLKDDVPGWLPRTEVMSDGTKVLPSDMDRRGDIPHIIKKEWEEAEHAKVEMEELQRHDRRLRAAADEKRANK